MSFVLILVKLMNYMVVFEKDVIIKIPFSSSGKAYLHHRLAIDKKFCKVKFINSICIKTDMRECVQLAWRIPPTL